MMRKGKKKLILSFLAIILFALGSIVGCDDGEEGGGGVIPPLVVSENKLNVEILDATIPSDRKPVVTIRLTDDRGNPLSSDGVRIRLVIARIENGERQYTNYITNENGQPSSENSDDGTLQDEGKGVFSYTFNFVLPENFDRDVTHTVGIYADREVDFKRYVSNATFDFVPSGGSVTTIRDIVRVENCNNCHNPLRLHGGFRRDTRLCVLCHTPQNTDPETGNTVDFKVMVHKIHRGAELPSVQAGTPYQIIGFNDTVFDFSTVEFPQDIRNCTKCHTGGTQSDNYKTEPSRAACGSCHDDVNFASGENHGGGIQLSDNNCKGCHLPSTGNEFDLSVVGTHTIPLKSVQVPGVIFEIVSVESAETMSDTVAPGEHPRVTFNIRTDAGDIIPPSDMNFLRLALGGPTTDYSIQDYNDDGVLTPGDPLSPWTPGAEDYKQEDPRQSAVGPDASGNFTYTFTALIPTDATGTYTVGIEGFKCATVQGASQRKGGTNCDGTRDPNGNGTEDPGEAFNQVRDAGHNVVFYFPVTDSEAVPRRMAVDSSTKCIACHGVFSKDFSIHGGIRNDSEYCVLCHNPSHDSLSRQLPPIGEMTLTNTVHYKVMIHKIHTGEDLTNKPYLLYSPPRGTFPDQVERPVDFSEVRFPGDRRDCETCHLAGTNLLDAGRGVLGSGVLPSTNHEFIREESNKTVTETFFTEPVIAACTACHDSLVVNEAGDALTGENHPGGAQPDGACVGCHGVGEFLGVKEVHLPPLPPERRIERAQ
ncbi:MAG: OmcA/MtrC family decaheme c-type cytochrome [Thermodesulfobacteriota bacterium]